MSEKEKIVMYNTIGISILNILLNGILIPRYGMNGAATATALSIVLINLIMLIQVYKYLNIHPYNRNYLKPIVAGTVTAAIILCGKFLSIFENQMLLLVTGILFCSACYVVIIKIAGFNEQDRLILNTIKLRIKS